MSGRHCGGRIVTDSGLCLGEREAAMGSSVPGGPPCDVRLVHEMPEIAETEFRDHLRTVQDLDRALSHPPVHVVVLHGSNGSGRTALIRELRRRLHACDPELNTKVDATIYLSGTGYLPINTDTLLSDLYYAATGAHPALRPGDWSARYATVLTALGRRSV